MSRPYPPLLTRDLVIEVASEIIDSEGAAAISMRRLATELGVKGPSLYHHFASKDEILDGVVEGINRQIQLECRPPDWEGIIREYALQLRGLLQTHPHMVEFFALRPVTSQTGLELYELSMSRLAECGWSPALAREIFLATENLVFGAALMANAPSLELTAEQLVRYPTLAISAATRVQSEPDDAFDLGFTAFVVGLRSLAREQGLPDRP